MTFQIMYYGSVMESLLLNLCLIFAIVELCSASLIVGYYKHSCPNAESIVRQTVYNEVAESPGLAAGLIRLHFHDCFVRGCDASILLDPLEGKEKVEKLHPANNPSLRGFEVIDKAKAALEAKCPHTVSCADVIAFAARDAVHSLGGIDYATQSGRRDGRVSRDTDVTPNLPAPTFNSQQLVQNFTSKGLTVDEMVTLSGAHSIGVFHCSSITKRLYNFSKKSQLDPSLDEEFAHRLRTMCPKGSNATTGPDPTVHLDERTPNVLDNKYYKNLRKGQGVLASDQTLCTCPSTADLVNYYAEHHSEWQIKFAKAMVRLGNIEVLTGGQGEIRKKCRISN